MKYLKNFESHSISTDYYENFEKSDFPDFLKFDNPKSEYELVDYIFNSNSVHITYNLSSDQPESDNPYMGNIPDIMTLDFSITYDMGDNESTSCFLKIISGSQVWLEFSFKDGEYKYSDITKCELSTETNDIIKKLINKYS